MKTTEELDALPAEKSPLEPSDYPVRLTAAPPRLAGGASLRVPDVHRPRDLALLERPTRAFPPLGDHASEDAEFSRELNAPTTGPCSARVVCRSSRGSMSSRS